MKRILFCISDFRQGGIPRCLQTLLMYHNPDEYKIDMVSFFQDGPYRNQMPNCEVIPEDFITHHLMVHSKKINLKNFVRYVPSIAIKILDKLQYRLTHKQILLCRMDKLARKLSKERHYDCAIAYAEGYPAFFVDKLNADRRLLWIHNDYDWIPPGKDTKILTPYHKFDKIVCVSNATQHAFERFFKDLKDKSITIYNLTNHKYIIQQSLLPQSIYHKNDDVTGIISIGRICWQKHFDITPSVAARLKNAGGKFVWNIVGSGSPEDVANLENEIKKLQVSDCVKLLGSQDNPFNLLRAHDLMVMTSRYESYPTVINEAKVLGIPIVAIDIPPLHEMMDDGEILLANEQTIAQIILKAISSSENPRSESKNPPSDTNDEILNQLDALFFGKSY